MNALIGGRLFSLLLYTISGLLFMNRQANDDSWDTVLDELRNEHKLATLQQVMVMKLLKVTHPI